MDEGKLEKMLQKMRDLRGGCLGAYRAGFLDESGLRESCASELLPVFENCLRELGLRRKEPFTNESMRRYEDDYELWAAGEDPASTAGELWLLRVSEGGLSAEAAAGEKAAYFDLAREALCEIVVCEIPPDDMEHPVKNVRIYGDGTRVFVPFDCVDDGGLAACNDPYGRHFTLTDSKGLRAEILVDEAGSYPDGRQVWEKGRYCSGLVFVEGYTAPGLRNEGSVSIDGGRVTSVTYYDRIWTWSDNPHLKELCSEEEYKAILCKRASHDDVFTVQLEDLSKQNEQAFLTFPRWQPFFEWTKAHSPRTISPTFDEYIQQLMS